MHYLRRFLRRSPAAGIQPTLAALQQDFPFELVECRTAQATVSLTRLRQQGRTQGFTPILISDAECVDSLSQQIMSSERSPAEILATASNIDVAAWFAEREQEELEPYTLYLGEWPNVFTPHNELEFRRKPQVGFPWRPKSVYLAKIPTANSWEVPAFLAWGGWNACPAPEHHVAIAHVWHIRYGAELAVTTSDTLEFLVERPPTDRNSAEALATEQFSFCNDIVTQGVGSIRNLASFLLNGTAWYFWWD